MLLTNIEHTSKMTLYRICSFLIYNKYVVDMTNFLVQVNDTWRPITSKCIIESIVDCLLHDQNPLLDSKQIDDIIYDNYGWILDGTTEELAKMNGEIAAIASQLSRTPPESRYGIQVQLQNASDRRMEFFNNFQEYKRQLFNNLFKTAIIPTIDELQSQVRHILTSVDNPYGYYDIRFQDDNLYVEFLGDMRIREFNLRNNLPEWNHAKVTLCRTV